MAANTCSITGVPEHVDSLEPFEDWQRQTYDRGKKRKNYNNRSGWSGRPKSYSTPDGERLHGNCREIDKHATNVKILKKYHPAVCVLHKDLAEGSSPVNGWSEELIGCHALSLRTHRLAGWTRRSLYEITSWPRSACWKLPYDTKFRTLSAFRRRS